MALTTNGHELKYKQFPSDLKSIISSHRDFMDGSIKDSS